MPDQRISQLWIESDEHFDPLALKPLAERALQVLHQDRRDFAWNAAVELLAHRLETQRVFNVVVGSIAGLAFGPLGAVIGGALGDLASKLWGKTKQTIVDSGLQFGGSVRDLQAGMGFDQYASIDTTKSSWFGLKKKTSNRIETAGLDDELSAQFGLVFTNVEKALEAAAVSMGVGADHVTSVLDSLSIEMTKVSLKGLSGDELTAAISAVISKATMSPSSSTPTTMLPTW